jgi:hypothetical protein
MRARTAWQADQTRHSPVELAPADRTVAVAIELIEQAVARTLVGEVRRRTMAVAAALATLVVAAGTPAFRPMFAETVATRAAAGERAVGAEAAARAAVSLAVVARAHGGPRAFRMATELAAIGTMTWTSALAGFARTTRAAAGTIASAEFSTSGTTTTGTTAGSVTLAPLAASAATMFACLFFARLVVGRGLGRFLRARCGGLSHKYGCPRLQRRRVES